MILERVLRLYDSEADLVKRRAPGRGNPTASQAGACAAQLQMLRFPELTHPEPRPIRAAWVFEDGDRHAEDLRQKIQRAFPGMSGLAEELFYFPVPVDFDTEHAFTQQILDGRLWGHVRPGFVPPKITLGHAGAKDRMRLAPRDERPGFIVDPGSGVFWVPLHVDHILRHQGLGRLVVVEFKSMSRFSFRRAVVGQMDYRNRVQLAVIAEATGLDVVWFLKCKDTAHLLEIAFLGETERTRVTLLRSNGMQETYFVARHAGVGTSADGGAPVALREDETWDVGEVWTPREPQLLAQARARILRVLLHQPGTPEERLKTWHREYGPSFVCTTCAGTGIQTLRKGGSEPLKKPKPCEQCASGIVEETQLPVYPCGYCPVIAACWPMARLEVTDKPRYLVTRAEVEAAGLTIHAPEGGADVQSEEAT